MNFYELSTEFVLRVKYGEWLNVFEAHENEMIAELTDDSETQYTVNADAEVTTYGDGECDVVDTSGNTLQMVAYRRLNWEKDIG
jgi:hypothetical protein